MNQLPFIYAGGLIFGFGLALSGMSNPDVVISFLTLNNFGLMLVMGGAIAVTLPTYNWIRHKYKTSLNGSTFQKYETIMTRREYVGAALFGVGWGLSGLCPGAALAGVGTLSIPVFVGVLGIMIGAYIHGRWLPR